MDGMDIKLLRAMGIRPYDRVPRPPERLRASWLADEVGASVNTVKERIARMEASGVIAGYQIVPNFDHLGLQASAFLLRLPEGAMKEACVAVASTLEGGLEVHDFLHGGVCVELAYANEGERDARLAPLRKSAEGHEPIRFYDREMPRVGRTLTPLDWRILRALRWKATRPLAEVADEIGVSARTVKRRFERMAAEGSFLAVPIVDPAAADGLILFDLLLYLEESKRGEAVRALRTVFDEQYVYAHQPRPEATVNFDMLLFARTPREMDTIRRKALAIPGVLDAEAVLFRGFTDTSRWIDALIDERAAR